MSKLDIEFIKPCFPILASQFTQFVSSAYEHHRLFLINRVKIVEYFLFIGQKARYSNILDNANNWK
jgi:hypothetical protein